MDCFSRCGKDNGMSAIARGDDRLEEPARRCASTCSLTVRGTGQAGFGWVCLNPETVGRLGLKPGDAVWLSDKGTSSQFSIVSHKDVGRGQAWLNPREMAAMELRDGDELAASGVYPGAPPLPAGPKVYDLIGVMAVMRDGRRT
jgi:hypothetical protein